jgi:hypothetical protein
MPDTSEQAQLRQHLREMREAAGSLGHDVRLEIASIDLDAIDRKITKLGKASGREAEEILADISDDFRHAGKLIGSEARRLPAQVGSAAARAGGAIGSSVTWAASSTASALGSAHDKAREGVKNAGARIAGVKRTPMKEWHTPSDDSDSR